MAGKLKKTTEEISADIKTEAQTKKATEVVEFSPTGCTLLDCAAGGGLGVGKIHNFIGDNSTGKTLLALECIAAAKKKYGDKLKIRYNAVEGGFSFDCKAMYGFEVEDKKKKPSEHIQEFDLDLQEELDALKPGETLIYVLDSLDGLSSKDELDAGEERRKAVKKGTEIKGSYKMDKAKFLSEFFRTKAVMMETKRCILIVISQVRFNVNGGMYAPQFIRSGGKGLDFYAAQVWWLYVKEKKERKGRIYGVTVLAKNDKNKLGLPYRKCYIDILFDYGLDNISSNLIFLNDLRTPEGKLRGGKDKDAPAKKCGFKDFVGSLDDCIEYVETQGLEAELAAAVKEKWSALELEVGSSKRKRRF